MTQRPRHALRAFTSQWTHAIFFLLLALIAVAEQAFANAGSVSPILQTRFVDALQILTSSFAVACCLVAAARLRGVYRTFWILFAAAIALQLCGNIGWARAHFFGIAVSPRSMFPSLFYRLYAGPMTIALFLSDERHGSKFQAFLDGCIVVGLVGLTTYQIQIGELTAHNPKIWQSISLTTAVNAILLLAAAARWWFSDQGALRSLFRRQLVYLAAYVCVCVVTSLVDAYASALSSYADLLWSASYLVAAALAATWKPPIYTLPRAPGISRRAALLCFNLTLATMVLASAVLGLRLVDSSRVVGLAGCAIVLFSFAIRSALMQDAQEKTLAELQDSKVELRRQALYDELTSLPNRRLFADRLGQALAGAKRDGRGLALLYLDLDGFKPVNDRFGHAAGDRVLVEVARRLRSGVRESDTVARMGGDEFTVLLSIGLDRSHATRVANLILESLRAPIAVDSAAISLTASIGVAVFPENAQDSDTLIELADRAMYAVKRLGRNGVQFHPPQPHPGNSGDPDNASPTLISCSQG
ncbi:MAG TPA: GGDEF domain-containing protein [Acidobacteriaceae bacterium]